MVVVSIHLSQQTINNILLALRSAISSQVSSTFALICGPVIQTVALISFVLLSSPFERGNGVKRHLQGAYIDINNMINWGGPTVSVGVLPLM